MAESTADVLARLKRQEETTGRSGAVPMMPKQMMLDAREVEAKHPDKRIRWVSLSDKNKMASRKAEGYSVLDEKDGGRKIGDEMVLMSMPREIYEQRVARQREENERRMNAHQGEWGAQMEAAARDLQDRFGIRVSADQLSKL